MFRLGARSLGISWVFALAACSSGNFDLGAPADPDASTTADTRPAPVDSGSSEDTSVADTSVADTSMADTSATDSNLADAFAADTFVADTFVADTFVADTFVPDAKPDGAVCPMPLNTKPAAIGTPTCSDLQGKYAGAVGEAKRCGCDADCRKTMVRGVCGCDTFVNPGSETYPTAQALLERWTFLGCVTICPDVLCPLPTSATCVPDPLGGSFKVCKDAVAGPM